MDWLSDVLNAGILKERKDADSGRVLLFSVRRKALLQQMREFHTTISLVVSRGPRLRSATQKCA
ncbi:hypothetical protein CHD23_09780 [Salmonella enterica]|nr:hypothetical protein CHD23_09780 [Salmonella enterica]